MSRSSLRAECHTLRSHASSRSYAAPPGVNCRGRPAHTVTPTPDRRKLPSGLSKITMMITRQCWWSMMIDKVKIYWNDGADLLSLKVTSYSDTNLNCISSYRVVNTRYLEYIIKHQQMHSRIIKMFIYYLERYYMFRHRVVPSSGRSKFLAKINYYIKMWRVKVN
jgi:hypothetical protein